MPVVTARVGPIDKLSLLHDVRLTGLADGHTLVWDNLLQQWKNAVASGGGAPAGSSGQIQYNNAGAMGASANLALAAGARLLVGAPTDDTVSRLQVNGQISSSGKLTGGTYASLFQNYIDVSSTNAFPAVDYIFPAGNIFRAAQASVYGTNDTFFQAIPGASGYGALETFGGLGTVLSTSGTGPVSIRPNRSENGRFTTTGLALAGPSAINAAARLHLYTADSTYDGPVMRADSYNLAGQYYSTFSAKNTSGGVINWTFDVTNGSTLYSNNLVMDRGNVGIGVATPLASLHVAGKPNANTAYFKSDVTAGQGFGPLIDAGTTSADYALLVRNQAGSADYFKIQGDGAASFAKPVSLNDATGSNYINSIGSNTISFGWQLTSSSAGFIPLQVNAASGATSNIFQCNDGTPSMAFSVTPAASIRLKPLLSAPASPVKGEIYVGTDGHAYVYSGAAWKQMDN